MARRGRPPHPDILTPREWEVLALLGEELSNQQIADRLGITERTAKFHVSEIMSKLGVSSREEAAAWRDASRAQPRPWWLAAGAPFAFAWSRTVGIVAHIANAAGLAVAGVFVTAAVAGIVLASVMLARGGGGDGSALSQADCLKTPPSIPTGELPTGAPGQRPQGRCGITVDYTVPFPTSTPDTSNALPPEQALAQLLGMPNVGAPIQAALDGDVDGLLALIDWQDHPCGLREGSDACPEGVAPGTELPSANVGGAITFWAREETVRPVLEDLLSASVSLTFASKDGERYYIGLQGDSRPLTTSIIWGDADAGTGVFLVIDSTAERPVAAVHPLVGEPRAAEHAALYGYTDYEILAYVP